MTVVNATHAMDAKGASTQNEHTGSAGAAELAAPAEPLEQTLAGALALATDTRRVVVARGALEAVVDVFAATFGRRPAVVVADETTYGVAGRAVDRRLRDAGLEVVDPYVFPASHGGAALHADYEHAARLGAALARHHAIPVAAGAGTINDLAKLGAHLAERPYMVV